VREHDRVLRLRVAAVPETPGIGGSRGEHPRERQTQRENRTHRLPPLHDHDSGSRFRMTASAPVAGCADSLTGACGSGRIFRVGDASPPGARLAPKRCGRRRSSRLHFHTARRRS
jgi:hypothetical protein